MSSTTTRDLNDRPPAQPAFSVSRNVSGIENACFPLSNNAYKGSDDATIHAGKPRPNMPPRTMTIQRLPLDILAEILAALLHLHEVDLPVIDSRVRPFIRAVPAASQVWRAHRKALLRRVALEQLEVLKRRALRVRRIQLQCQLRSIVRRAAFLRAPALEDPLEEEKHRFRLYQRDLATHFACSFPDMRAMWLASDINRLRSWLRPGDITCELDWTKQIFFGRLHVPDHRWSQLEGSGGSGVVR
ncbi:hypothetical protein FN846DRAFT_910753 [Sphaerosporella brunnea]|uniref:Uncharacterized protein n=1 Tax=Sphaerosporella brunnea TaxID=1250544 RepID=A0A5J5EMC5_9PEZI|nr:hypothetical protein FN846DRAFT_910753 [Sphaerosporella brunnea]